MATREIKTKIVLEGEQQYRQQMTDAANAIKVLNAQQKAAVAEANAAGDAQKAAAEKAKYLEQKIAEQRKAVEAAEAAIKQLTADGVQPNTKTMQTWQRKLADAQTGLYNMQGELKDTKAELENEGAQVETNTEQTGKMEEALDNVNMNVSLDNVTKAIDAVAGALTSVIRGVARAAKALWDWESEGADWADELITQSKQLGFDVETLQAWKYASLFIDTEVETIIGAQDKLLKAMRSTSTDTVDAWKQIGIATHNMDGTLRDSQTVFWEVLEALGSMEDQTAQEALAQQLLGRSFRDLNPLLEAGRDAWEQYVAEGRDVAVVSAENVEKLGDLDDAQNKLQASLDATKYEALAALAPVFTEISAAMAEAVAGFREFLQTEEGQAALMALKDSLTGVIHAITGENGEGFQKIMELATTAVEGLTGALNWIVENYEKVAAGLVAIGGAIAGLKLTSLILKTAQVIKNLTTIANWGKGGAAAAGGKAAASGGGAAKAGAGIKGLLGKIGSGLSSFGASAAPVLGAGAAGLLMAAPISIAVDNAYTKARYGAYNNLLDKLPDITAAAGDTQEAQIINAMQEALAAWESEEPDIDPVRAVFEQYAADLAERVGFDIAEALGSEQFRAQDWADAGYDLVTELAAAIEAGETTPATAAASLGANVASNVAAGITSNIWRVQNAMASLISAASARATLPSIDTSGARTGQGGTTLNATIVMDRQKVGRLVSPVVDGVLGSKLGRLGG